MSLWSVIFIALGLSMDAVAVCVAAAAGGHAANRRAVFRLAFHFGLFQFLMPILGWAMGEVLVRHITSWDHWLAFGLLAVVGGRMLYVAAKPEVKETAGDPSRGLTMVMLSTATSLDALAVGLSLALSDIAVWFPSALIGLITGGMCLIAIALGNRLRSAFSRWAEAAGGLTLIGIGLRILLTHLH
jgi:putative Mn2+ efflux pump MntP